MSEVPKEPGRWACREYGVANGVKHTLHVTIGFVHRNPGNGELYFKSHYHRNVESEFHNYDWHRIKLPEGWE